MARREATGAGRRRWRVAVTCLLAVVIAAALPATPAAAADIELDVAPTAGLVDGQAVEVTVRTFYHQVRIAQCDAAVGPAPTVDETWRHCGNHRTVDVTGPEMTVEFRAYEVVLSAMGDTVVCGDAADDCVIAVTGPIGEDFTSVPIGMVPGLPAPLAVEVEPPTGLGEHFQVIAYVAGGRTEPVRMALCGAAVVRSRDIEHGPCLPAVDVPGGRARVGISFEPFRQFVGADGRFVRCDDEPGACVVAVGTSDGSQFASAPISFLRDLSLEVSPSRRLRDGQEVRVRAGGLRPDGRYTVVRCAVQDPVVTYYDCEPDGTHEWVTATARGTLSTVVPATDRINTPDGLRTCRTYCSFALIEDGYGIDITAPYTMR